jgi:hypothetical protein
VVCIYGIGSNPYDYKNKDLPLRRMLASVVYEKSFFGENKPRTFQVYILKPNVDYYSDLDGTIKGS